MIIYFWFLQMSKFLPDRMVRTAAEMIETEIHLNWSIRFLVRWTVHWIIRSPFATWNIWNKFQETFFNWLFVHPYQIVWRHAIVHLIEFFTILTAQIEHFHGLNHKTRICYVQQNVTTLSFENSMRFYQAQRWIFKWFT